MGRNYRYQGGLAAIVLMANFLSSHSAFSAAPIAFDSWSESAGVITTSCPLGFSCNEEITGSGMFQQLITSATGDRYYHQIIADSGGRDGLMELEAFIYSTNTPESGMALKQYIEDSDTYNSFNSSVVLMTGWANQGEDSIDTNQFMASRSPDFASILYTDEFKYFQKRDASGTNIGKFVDITQGQLDSTYYQGDKLTSGEDRYTFVNRIAAGVYTYVSGSVSVFDRFGGGGMRRRAMSTTSSAGTMNWSVGDELQAIWIGNRCDDCTDDISRLRDYSFESYENITTGQGVAGQRGSTYLSENWIEQLFGTTPPLINY